MPGHGAPTCLPTAWTSLPDVGVVAGDRALEERGVDDGLARAPGPAPRRPPADRNPDHVPDALAVPDDVLGEVGADVVRARANPARSGQGTRPEDQRTTVSEVLVSLSTLIELKLPSTAEEGSRGARPGERRGRSGCRRASSPDSARSCRPPWRSRRPIPSRPRPGGSWDRGRSSRSPRRRAGSSPRPGRPRPRAAPRPSPRPGRPQPMTPVELGRTSEGAIPRSPAASAQTRSAASTPPGAQTLEILLLTMIAPSAGPPSRRRPTTTGAPGKAFRVNTAAKSGDGRSARSASGSSATAWAPRGG